MKTYNVLKVSFLFALMVAFVGCSHEKVKTKAKETASRYWLERAYPGKGYDVQVTQAEEVDDGLFKVKGVVDGEVREGTYDPRTDLFSEGYYPIAKEKSRHIAELEQQLKYWKEHSEELERENYKLKVKLGIDEKKADASAPKP